MKKIILSKRKILIVICAIILLCIIVKAVVGIFSTKTVVCIDAGHGGSDVGAVYEDDKRYEKDDNLKIAKAVRKELKKQNIKVVMTRDADKTLSLEDRCKKANSKKVDLFVSIHRNSSETSGNGIEIWVNGKDNKEDLSLADNILDKLDKTEIQSNRGVKTGTIESSTTDYYVNKNTKMPSCLIELGFISNEKDNKLLDENINEYAKAIADGIVKTLKDK